MTTAELIRYGLHPIENASKLAKTTYVEPDRTYYRFFDGSELMIERARWVHMPKVVVIK